MTITLRIYVAVLADYNAGRHHGKWLEVTDEDTMRAEIDELFKSSPAGKEEGRVPDEFAIHDFEGFAPLRLSEYTSIADLCQIGEAVTEHGEAYLAWASNSDDNRDPDAFQDAFRGRYDSLEDYVREFWEESGDLPKAPEGSWWHPANYIDFDRMAHDLELSGDIFTAPSSDGGVFIFDNT